jgi:hypothetical protein
VLKIDEPRNRVVKRNVCCAGVCHVSDMSLDGNWGQKKEKFCYDGLSNAF